MHVLRRQRRFVSMVRKRTTRRTLRNILSAICALIVLGGFIIVLIFGTDLDNFLSRHSDIESRDELTDAHSRYNPAFTRVGFGMSDAMANAWLTSSERLKFETEIKVGRINITKEAQNTQGESSRMMEDQISKVSAILYGKSSLKLKHTKRRSLHIRSEKPINFLSYKSLELLRGNHRGGDAFENEGEISLNDFLLLSLWEDTHRIAYRTSIDLLRHLDLFLPYAQLVELWCYPSTEYPISNHPCVASPTDHSIKSQEKEGRSLGVYLMLEFPSKAIWRRMRNVFKGFEKELENSANVTRGIGNNNDSNNAVALALARREYETEMEYTARIHRWRNMWKITKELYDGDVENAVQLASRNFVGFREPRHDLSHVPSYKKNSTVLPGYRLVEKKPLKYGLLTEATATPESFLDLPQYMSWLAINTILRNGDYDDEAFFYGVLQPTPTSTNALLKSHDVKLPVHLGLMGWDYDNIFAPCHRKLWFETPLMYCAESTLDHNILHTPELKKRYIEILRYMLYRIDRVRFRRSVDVANNELIAILHGSPGALQATFNTKKRDDDTGVQWIMNEFMNQREHLLRTLAPLLSREEVEEKLQSMMQSSDKGNQGDVVSLIVDGVFSNTNTEIRRELLRHLSKAVQMKKNRITTRDGIVVKGVQHALGEELQDGGKGYILSTPGMYCVRVEVPQQFLLTGKLLPNLAMQLHQEKRNSLIVNMPLVGPNPMGGEAEHGLWTFDKPQAMKYLHSTVDNNSILKIIMPSVWPREIRKQGGLFVARFLRNEKNTEGSESFTWVRRNTPLVTSDAPLSKTMIVRGFSAIRMIRILEFANLDTPIMAERHDKENTINGPLLYINCNTTENGGCPGDGVMEFIIPGTNIRHSISATSLPTLPPSAPLPTSSSSSTSGLIDVHGNFLGSFLEAGHTMICRSPQTNNNNNNNTDNNNDNTNSTVHIAQCPVFISDGYHLREGSTLEVGPGCVVVLLHAALLRVVGGTLRFNGTIDSPVVVTSRSASDNSRWRTIHLDGSTAQLHASYTFFTGSGISKVRVPGTGKHHSHSAAISATNGALVSLEHTFMLELLGAAIAAGKDAVVRVVDSLVQWAQMGIECVHCTFTSHRSVWTNFPSWDVLYSDNDNDAMYLSGGEHRVMDTVVAHTKDDGIDTGAVLHSSGDSQRKNEGGSLVIHNSIIEGCMHEGVALSSGPTMHRKVLISHTIIQYCQQGVEVGYTSENHTGFVISSLIQHSTVGVRFGDNYRWSHCDGKLLVLNTTLAYNELNAMNYERGEASPKGVDNFYASTTLPSPEWELLQEVANHSALPLSITPSGMVLKLLDVRANTLLLNSGTGKNNWSITACSDIFSLPGNNSKTIGGVDASLVPLAEENFIVNVTVNL